MSKNINYYHLLGVHHTAELIVIKAAYRALIKKYHPDVFRGSKKEADKIVKELNNAYEILSDDNKRAEYDFNLKSKPNSFNRFDIEENTYDTSGLFKDEWELIIEYYPKAENERQNLLKLSQIAALYFQIILIETKDAKNYKNWAKIVEKDFMESFFGSNRELNAFVKKLLIEQHHDIVEEINQAISVLGEEEIENIIKTTKEKYLFKLNNVKKPTKYLWAKKYERFLLAYEFPADSYNYFVDISYDAENKSIYVEYSCYEKNDDEEENEYPILNFQILTLDNQILFEPEHPLYEEQIEYSSFDEARQIITEKLQRNL